MAQVILIINSILLGAGLAMDAFSVSLVHGMTEPAMRRGRKALIAGVFAGFQLLMPLTGWLCVHTLVESFRSFQKWIPWIALCLLVYIGVKMLLDARREAVSAEAGECPGTPEGSPGSSAASEEAGTLLLQGVATSIDALSVGFTIAQYSAGEALLCSLLIGGVTYVICRAGIRLGIRFGTRLSAGAQTLGGTILILLGLEIFLKSMFFGG
jgi:putative Mn2+ efflux pump MntP